jgi:hypothetical protein
LPRFVAHACCVSIIGLRPNIPFNDQILHPVAAFIAILFSIRSLNEITDDDAARAHLKSDIPRLRERAKLLNNAAYLALVLARHLIR